MSEARERTCGLRQSLEVISQMLQNQLIRSEKAGLIDLPCKRHCMRRFISIGLALGFALTVNAQYIPAFPKAEKEDPGTKYWSKGNLFRHMEVSLTVGTSGVGIDLAAPLCEFMQIRMGYDYMPQFSKSYDMNIAGGGQAARQYNDQGNRIRTPFDKIEQYMYEQTGSELEDHIVMNSKLNVHNMKFLIDIYPFKYNKHWHFTTGIYWGPEEFAKAENDPQSDKTISLMKEYNQRYEAAKSDDAIKGYGKLNLNPGDAYLTDPTEDGKVSISTTSNAIKPYIGAGYTGRLVKSRDDWKISAELGIMIWGGTPVQRLHDGTDLSKDLTNIPGKMGDVISFTKALKVYPVLSVRFAKTIF